MKTFYCIAVILTVAYCSDSAIDYSAQGDWGGVCNTGDLQSPINVVHDDDTTLVKLDSIIDLGDAADSLVATNENNDNALKFSFDSTLTYTIPGLNVEGTVVQLHIHWGNDSSSGSEHKLNGDRYLAETHLVTTYTSGDETKYAVIARLFEDGDADPCVAAMITSQEASGDARTISGFNLTALYPSTISYVVTYDGSLTTPDCDEKVYWIIVTDPHTIASTQLDSLRALSLGDGTAAAKALNWRDTQDTNERSFTCYKSAARTSFIATPLLLLLALVKLVL